MIIKEDSVARRYIYKLIASFVSLVCNICIMLIVPRVLGPMHFGSYTFLYNFFSRTLGFLDNSSSIALYTRLSQNNDDRSYLTFYLVVVALIFLCLFCFVGAIQLLNFEQVIWPQQEIGYIWLGLLVAATMWFSRLLQRVSDAYALTVESSKRQVLYRVSMLFVLAILLINHSKLTLYSYFLYQIIMATIFSMLLFQVLMRGKIFTRSVLYFYSIEWRKMILDFWHYCSPLYVYGLAGLLSALSNSWLLQKFSGSIEQGYYGLGLSIATACFLFTSSITSIFTREYAIAYKNNNRKEQQRLFKLYIPLFYLITSFFSVFIFTNASWVILVIGGEEYKAAMTAVMIMSLYPIHQTYGQLVGGVYYASGNTRGYRNVGVFTLSLGVLLAYFFLAPHDYYGLHLGALGSALQMILIQFIGVNILTYFHVRRLGLSFGWFLLNQFSVIFSLAILASAAHYLIVHGLSLHQPLQELFISAVIYFIIFIFAIWTCPKGFGLTRELINTALDKGRAYAKRF